MNGKVIVLVELVGNLFSLGPGKSIKGVMSHWGHSVASSQVGGGGGCLGKLLLCTAGAGTWRSHKHCWNLMLEKLLEMQELGAEETVNACRNLPVEHTETREKEKAFLLLQCLSCAPN